MPPQTASPGRLKPGSPVKPTAEPSPNGENKPAAKPAPEFPWSSPSKVSDLQGLSMMLFAMAGHGKTTLLLSMLHALDEGPLLIFNFDEELRSISDLGDDSGVMVWPGEKQGGKIASWGAADAFCNRILVGKHPFKYLAFDTLNSMYELALKDVKARNPGARDPRQIYGEANDMVLGTVKAFCGMAREKGMNVVFTAHAEEKQVGENGPIYIRPKITPGVVQGINQAVSLIGYLGPPIMGKRTLQLAPSKLIASKIHQPRTGPQVPDKIKEPDLGLLINHLKHHKRYPTGGSSD